MSHKQPFVAPMENRDEAEKARRSMADKGVCCVLCVLVCGLMLVL